MAVEEGWWTNLASGHLKSPCKSLYLSHSLICKVNSDEFGAAGLDSLN